MQESQKGINRIESNNTKKANIRSIMFLYYTLGRKKQTRRFYAI